ncbi:MAG: DUF1273 family protein [Clostridia bacterium]|nr:DUF1273 family protein [Clostridia bacterium]
MSKTVCFTGHRQIPDADYPQLEESLRVEVERQILQGATDFRTGGAVGFDTLSALSVLSLRMRYPEIRLHLILPSPDQTVGWRETDAQLYRQILSQADSHRYVAQKYYPGLLQQRNRALVDGADVCIAYLRNSHGGGTAYTAALALKSGLELINLYDTLQN